MAVPTSPTAAVTREPYPGSDALWIHQQPEWPRFEWDVARISPLLAQTRHLQGWVLGRMSMIGFDLQQQANLDILTQEVIKSSEIEGESFQMAHVSASIAKRLGLDHAGAKEVGGDVEGAVAMALDAARNHAQPLTVERLAAWHEGLFPLDAFGFRRILAGQWRDDASGPMQVISGPMGMEIVHYEAPPAARLDHEMGVFLEWLNARQSIDPVIKAALAHFWFVMIHPFEDGNGRIARSITDLCLARSDGQQARYYSMSGVIQKRRRAYYAILEHTQKGGMDVTEWVEWFLQTLSEALRESERVAERVMRKHRFWAFHGNLLDNERQRKIVGRLLEGFEGKLTTSKWAKIAKCSQDTALRDIQDLIRKGVLRQLPGGGRNTGYELEPLG